jgi:hypothetical protein
MPPEDGTQPTIEELHKMFMGSIFQYHAIVGLENKVNILGVTAHVDKHLA